MSPDLSAAQARRIALAAQGFTDARPTCVPTRRHFHRVLDRTGVIQIDSVNVVVRTHYLPTFSRLGAYPQALLEREAWGKKPSLFEYWGHEASLMPLAMQPLMRWRMERARGGATWSGLARFGRERRDYIDNILAEIEKRGPVTGGDFTDGTKGRPGWWEWSDGKQALEWLFWAGLVAATHRRGSFERVYDLPERVLPRAILQLPSPSGVDARRALLARSARALGVATADDLRDYYRIPTADARLPIEQLVEQGILIPVGVRGWRQQAYLHKDARPGRRLEGSALLSPFDPLIWSRPRTERVFGFRYRLEIYTPASKREHGYYVLPFLMDGALVARVDLKADRRAGALVVQRAHVESGAPKSTVERLIDELRLMASWLGLSSLALAPAAGLDRLFATLPIEARAGFAEAAPAQSKRASHG